MLQISYCLWLSTSERCDFFFSNNRLKWFYSYIRDVECISTNSDWFLVTFKDETLGDNDEIVSTREKERFSVKIDSYFNNRLLDSSFIVRCWIDSSLLFVLFTDEVERLFVIDRRTWAICFFKLATCFDRGSSNIQKKIKDFNNKFFTKCLIFFQSLK